MFLRETARPRTRREILQRLWLADSYKWVAHDGLDKVDDTERNLAIVLNPIAKILTKLVLENSGTTFLLGHGRRYSSRPTSRRSLAIVWARPLRRFARAKARSSRSAFFGDRSRCAFSMRLRSSSTAMSATSRRHTYFGLRRTPSGCFVP